MSGDYNFGFREYLRIVWSIGEKNFYLGFRKKLS
jgi:hypothetical protein